jgi:hypothetical protein
MSKHALTGAILQLLLIGSITSASIAQELSTAVANDSAQAIPAGAHKILVYYFYFSPRCETCLNMEAFSKEAMEIGFGNEIKQGSVVWKSCDVDKEEYKHFWDDYKLETKALIMVDEQAGKTIRWKNCEQIWDLAGAKPDFMKYVQNEVRAYLNPQIPIDKPQ